MTKDAMQRMVQALSDEKLEDLERVVHRERLSRVVLQEKCHVLNDVEKGLVKGGRKLQAIKSYRDRLDTSLATAVAVVSHYVDRGEDPPNIKEGEP